MRINTNNFYERKQEFCHPHFTSTLIKLKNDNEIEKINSWIYEHCHGRYAIVDDVAINGPHPTSVVKIGFEEPSDLTLFALSGLMITE